MNRMEDWIESVYDFLFIIAICIFGYGVQIGYMYLKDKLIEKKKLIALFFINLSVSYFLNRVMVQMGWEDWIWIGIWLYNATSFWLLTVIMNKLKVTIEKLVPGILEAWAEKFKPKKDDNTPV